MERNEFASMNLYNTFYCMDCVFEFLSLPVIQFTFQVHLMTVYNGLLVNFLARIHTHLCFPFNPPSPYLDLKNSVTLLASTLLSWFCVVLFFPWIISVYPVGLV